MELDVSILTLPVSDWLGQISPKGRKAIEKAHHELVKIAATQRKKPFEYGEWFTKIRDTLKEEKSEDSVASYCRDAGVDRTKFYECIRIFEAFQPYSDLLQMFPVMLQYQLSRGAMADLLLEAVKIARAGNEVTRAWFDDRMGVVESKSQKKMPPPDDDVDGEDEENEDIVRFTSGDDDDDEEEDRLRQREERRHYQDALVENSVALADLDEHRRVLCRELMEEVQLIKRRLVTFTKVNKVYEAGWFMKAEHGLDQFAQALTDWQQGDVIRVGE